MVLDSIYLYLENQAIAFDISEILRAQFLLIVSAMDYYIHEVVREGLLAAIDGIDDKPKLDKVSLPLETVKVLLSVDNEVDKRRFLDSAIRDTLSKDSYQSPRNIETALHLIGYRNLWHKLCDGTEKNKVDVKNQLSLIILRRNKIAHEADMNPISGEKEIMDRSVTKACLEHVRWIIHRMDELIGS